jgi:hypothetical protein
MFRKFLFFGLPILLIVGLLGFVVWGETPLPANSTALDALQSTPEVSIQPADAWLVFQPANPVGDTGFIFYPGGRVDYRAYAPLLSAIAEKGYLVVLVPMPLNLAVFGVEKAQAVIEAYPDIKHWAIGGHSLGGSMAAQFSENHPDSISGLVFWASYPASNMTGFSKPVLSISASNDGLATPAKIDDSRGLLPANTQFIVIEGGNHAQFGSYGAQPGDGTASIPAETQWAQTTQATTALLQRISQRK